MTGAPSPTFLEEYPGHLPVAQVIKVLNVTARAIQHYENIKLIKSKRVGKGNLRLLDQRNVDRLRAILEAKDLGFSLNEIAVMLEKTGDQPLEGRLHIDEEALAKQLVFLREEAERIKVAIRRLTEMKRKSRGERSK